MALKSKILIIGETRYIGKYTTKKSAKNGHLSFALVREKASNLENRACILEKKLPIISLQHILWPIIKISISIVISIQCTRCTLKVPVNQATSHSFVPPTEKVIDDDFTQQMERGMLQAL